MHDQPPSFRRVHRAARRLRRYLALGRHRANLWRVWQRVRVERAGEDVDVGTWLDGGRARVVPGPDGGLVVVRAFIPR